MALAWGSYRPLVTARCEKGVLAAGVEEPLLKRGHPPSPRYAVTCTNRSLKTDSGRFKKFCRTLQAIRAIGHLANRSLGILIIGAPIEQPAILGFSNSAPLLKEERHALLPTLPPNGDHPLPFHRTRPRPTLATNNHPGNSGQVDFTEILQQWLNRQKTNPSGSPPKKIYARQSMFPILDTDSPPDVLQFRRKP